MNRYEILILILLFSFTSAPLSAATMDLAQALNYAAKNSPQIQIQGESLNSQRLTSLNSRARLYPDLQVFTQAGRVGTSGGSWSDSEPYSQTGIGFSANLYNQGADWSSYQISRLQLQAQQYESDRVLDEQSLSIIQAFMEYSRQSLALEITEQRAQMIQEQHDRVERGYRSGVRARQDYLRLQAQLKRTQIELDRAKSEIERSANRLKQLIGAPANEEISFTSVSMDINSEFHIPEKIEAKDHIQYRIQEVSVLSQNEVVNQARRNFLPKLSVDVTAGQDFQNILSDSGRSDYQWQAMLSLSYNLLDLTSLRRDREIAQASYNIENYRLLAVELDLEKQLSDLQIALSRVTQEFQLSKELLELDEQSFQRIQSDYRRGESSYLEFVEALENFLNSRSGLIQNYYEYQSLIAEWKYHKGNLYEEYTAATR